MQYNCSGSKRKNINRSIGIYDNALTTSRIENETNNWMENYQYGYGEKRMDLSRRSSSAMKNYQDQDKQNCNYIQARLDKYQTPTCSPLKQQLYSPIKPPTHLYDPYPSRRAVGRRTSRNDTFDESQYTQPLTSRQSSKKQNKNSHDYPSNRDSYKMAPQRNSINYEVEFKSEYESIDQPPLSSRGPYKPSGNLGITFSNNTPYVTNIVSTTPKKGSLELDQLVQKSQFLKQRLERLNRMTPKGPRRGEEPKQITPQKLNFKETKEPYNQIVKYNKYCDEKLPLETIYDADEHKHEGNGREKTEEGEDGIQQISNMSRKISERLKSIINRHNN